MTRLNAIEVRTITRVAGMPVEADASERITNSIGPAFEGFSAIPAHCRSTFDPQASS